MLHWFCYGHGLVVTHRPASSLAVFHLGGVGGPQRSLFGAMSWLREQGRVEFIVPHRGATADMYGTLGPVAVRDYSVLTYARGARDVIALATRLARDVRLFRRELRIRRPELVIAVTTVLPALLLAARLERVPLVVYASELYRQEWKRSPALRMWGALLARFTQLLSAGLVCCSFAVARQFGETSNTPLAVAYPPVGLEYAGGDRRTGRVRHGVGAAHPCLAVVGNLSRGRGQDVAIRALSKLRERFPAAVLLVVGAPHERAVDLRFAAELRVLARELDLEDAVLFIGETDFMADVYAAADVVLNPARSDEAFGRVAAEAVVAGTPVVASRVGAVPEVIRDGVDGLLLAPDDPDTLAEAAGRVVVDRALAQRLTTNGRARVLERYGGEQDLAAWRAVVEAVIARQRPPSNRFRTRPTPASART
jgi:glycosyltransferase involved in cell wall biosynthesis